MGSPALFASTDLAARVERAECSLLAECADAVATRRPGAGVVRLPVAGGIATFTGPHSPMNKVAGLGFGGEIDEAELARIERAFFERGAPVQVELSSLADPAVAPRLSKRGYVLMGFEDVLGRRLAPGEPPVDTPEVDVRLAPDEEFATWLDVVVTGFETPDTQGVASHETFPRDTLESIVSDMSGATGFVRHLAWRGGEPAGGASLRLHEGIAQLCGASTLPLHRRRGVQSALLHERLRWAAERGCDLATVVTQPGSKSQENVQRQGFERLYTRAVLVREP